MHFFSSLKRAWTSGPCGLAATGLNRHRRSCREHAAAAAIPPRTIEATIASHNSTETHSQRPWPQVRSTYLRRGRGVKPQTRLVRRHDPRLHDKLGISAEVLIRPSRRSNRETGRRRDRFDVGSCVSNPEGCALRVPDRRGHRTVRRRRRSASMSRVVVKAGALRLARAPSRRHRRG